MTDASPPPFLPGPFDQLTPEQKRAREELVALTNELVADPRRPIPLLLTLPQLKLGLLGIDFVPTTASRENAANFEAVRQAFEAQVGLLEVVTQERARLAGGAPPAPPGAPADQG